MVRTTDVEDKPVQHPESGVTPKSLIRYATFLAAFAAGLLFVFWKITDALLLIYAGILFAALLDALTDLLGKAISWARGFRLAIVCAVFAVILIAALAWGGATLAAQGGELTTTLREQTNQMLTWLSQHGVKFPPNSLRALTEQTSQQLNGENARPTFRSVLPEVGGLFGPAWAAISTVLSILGDVIVIMFLGLFLAAQPAMYRDTLLLLAPADRRPGYRKVLDEAGETLRHWLLGQLVTMSLIALFVWIGLMLVGVEPALLLGLQAGLLAFVPTLGPFLAGIAIMLASLAFGLSGVIGALGVYLAVQTLESYLLTPMIQKRAISVPPAILFACQIMLGLLFGFYGLALATPLTAVARVFILRLYVESPPRPETESDET